MMEVGVIIKINLQDRALQLERMLTIRSNTTQIVTYCQPRMDE